MWPSHTTTWATCTKSRGKYSEALEAYSKSLDIEIKVAGQDSQVLGHVEAVPAVNHAALLYFLHLQATY